MIGLAFIVKAGFFIAGVVQAAMAVTEIKTAKVIEKNEVPQIDDSDIKNDEVKKQVKYFNKVSEEYTHNNIGLCKIKAFVGVCGSATCLLDAYACRSITTAPLPLAILSAAILCLSIYNYSQEIKNYKEVKNAYKNDSANDTDTEEIDDYQEV